jgi:nicotinamide-nucleotide amidase
MMPERLRELTVQLGETLKARSLTLVTAESCTGGWIAKAITDIPGSSEWFERGFVAYSNAAKVEMLGVSEGTLSSCGAVSAETVEEMLRGALARSHSQVAVAVSGIAGPDGGSPDKPVGTVWIGWAVKGGALQSRNYLFGGDREAVRGQSVISALEGVLDVISGP